MDQTAPRKTFLDHGRDFARTVVPSKMRRTIGMDVLGFFYRKNYYGLFGPVTGRIKSTRRMSRHAKEFADTFFQHHEKAEATLAAATSWYGGDYMEFGARTLYTFRDMLSAFDIAGLNKRFPDTQFYAFDVFGKLTSDNPAVQNEMAAFDARTSYFSMQFPEGDDYARHLEMLREHGLFTDRCHLIQGFFQDTLNAEFKAKYGSRQIGYAFIDCNFEEHYKTVFEFIFDLMAVNSYVYLDEGFQSSGAAHYFVEFASKLRDKRRIECMFVRSAGAFGGLYRLRPVRDELPELRV